MPTGDAYSSGHFLGFANVLLLRQLTLNHTLHYQFMTISLIWLLTEIDSFSWINITNSWHFPWFDSLLNLTSLNIGFHWASATGVACWQGTLTLPDYALRISLGTFSILPQSTCVRSRSVPLQSMILRDPKLDICICDYRFWTWRSSEWY